MRIGVVKEIKDRENRVALTPQGAEELVKRNHSVMVERGAGIGSGFDDEAYRRAGAMLVSAADAWGADLVVKVKEPLEAEYRQGARAQGRHLDRRAQRRQSRPDALRHRPGAARLAGAERRPQHAQLAAAQKAAAACLIRPERLPLVPLAE